MKQINVDTSVGSREYFKLFPQGRAVLAPCEFADFSFAGHGPQSRFHAK